MEVRLPKLGEGADSGTVVSVLVKTGQKIKKSDVLVELENEKAVAPIPSPASGVVSKIHVKEGDKLSVGQVIVSLEGADAGGAESSAAPKQAAAPSARPAERGSAQEPANHHYESSTGAPPPASPTVRKVAAELGIDLSRVRGSERGGRITMEDLRSYLSFLQEAAFRTTGTAAAGAPAAPARPAPESIDFSKWGKVTRKPVSSLRKTIGERMTESWTTIPHVTQFDEADITRLWDLRKKYAPAYEKKGAKLTITGFAILAVVAALKKYPQFRSSLDEKAGDLVEKSYFHIGIAVDTEQGLIVPVLRDADKKNLFELSLELDKLAEKTRARKVSLDDLKGGVFTISNLGSIGGAHFTPIVNKPEVAILGLGRGASKPVALKDKIETRLMLPVALSYDHRVIDGADGARFIRALVEAFEAVQEGDVKI